MRRLGRGVFLCQREVLSDLLAELSIFSIFGHLGLESLMMSSSDDGSPMFMMIPFSVSLKIRSSAKSASFVLALRSGFLLEMSQQFGEKRLLDHIEVVTELG